MAIGPVLNATIAAVAGAAKQAVAAAAAAAASPASPPPVIHSEAVDYHTVRAVMDGLFIVCSWILFFIAGWIFAYKYLFRDYEVKHRWVQFLFSATWTLSCSMIELVILEVLNSLHPYSRWLCWRFDIQVILVDLIFILPATMMYFLVGRLAGPLSRLHLNGHIFDPVLLVCLCRCQIIARLVRRLSVVHRSGSYCGCSSFTKSVICFQSLIIFIRCFQSNTAYHESV